MPAKCSRPWARRSIVERNVDKVEKLEICVKVKKLIGVDDQGFILFEDAAGQERRMVVKQDAEVALVDKDGQPLDLIAVYDQEALLGFTKADK